MKEGLTAVKIWAVSAERKLLYNATSSSASVYAAKGNGDGRGSADGDRWWSRMSRD